MKLPNSFDTFRISLIITLVFVSSLVLLSLTALYTSSKLQVTPQFFFDPKILGDSSQRTMIYSLKDTSGRNESGQKIIDEMLMRYYIQMRYEQFQDLPEMLFRWGRGGVIYVLSSPKVYKDFTRTIEEKVRNLPDMVQTVEIKNLKRDKHPNTGRELNSFSVDIVIYEQYPEGRVVSKEKAIHAEFSYVKGRRLFSPYLINPYGLVFRGFSEADNETQEK